MSHRNDLLIWHDAINNSITRHLSNNNRKLSSGQLVNLLLRYRTNNCAIVYRRRNGTEDIEESLGSTGILVLNVAKDFISKRKAKDQVLIEKYKKLHQPPSLELKTLLLLRRYSANLNILKTRKKRNRLPLKARKAIKNRLQAEALRPQVPPSFELMLIFSCKFKYVSKQYLILMIVFFLVSIRKILSVCEEYEQKIPKSDTQHIRNPSKSRKGAS